MTFIAQRRKCLSLGWAPPSGFLATGIALNGSASGGYSETWPAFGFSPDHNATVTSVRLYVSAVTGSLIASNYVCDIYSDSGGTPNSSLGSVTLGTAPTGAQWITFTSLSVSVSAGTQYWVVPRNANSSPTSNYPTYQIGESTGLQPSSGTNYLWGWQYTKSTNGGSTWSSTASDISGYRIGYSDGTYDGDPIQGVISSADHVYGSNASGAKFTSPANVTLNVAGLAFYCRPKSGSPSGNLQAQIYTGSTPTLLATSGAAIPNANVTSNIGWYYFYFLSSGNPTSVQIQPNTVVRAVISDTNTSDTSSNYFSMQEVQYDSDTNSLALMPWAGTCGKTFYNGSTWTDTSTSLFAHWLLLDSNGEFGASSGGGGGFVGSNLISAPRWPNNF